MAAAGIRIASRLRRALARLARVRHWRVVQADDPIRLMFRCDDGCPLCGPEE